MDASGREAAAPTVVDVERMLLAGDVDGAFAALQAKGDGDADDPAWARLRLAVAIAGRREVWDDREALARLIVPREGQPPPDLPALLIATQVPMATTVLLEHRMEQQATRSARRLLADGKAEEALLLLEQSLASLPQTATSFQLFARAAKVQMRPSDTLFALQRAHDLAPEDRTILAELAYAHLAVGETEEASRLLTSVDPDPGSEPMMFSARLRCLAESGGPDRDTVAREHGRFRAAAVVRGLPPRPDRDAGAPPLVGFLWPHAARGAEQLMTSLLRHRDPQRWSAKLYGHGITRRFLDTPLAALLPDRLLIDHMPDASVAERMLDDRVDILVSFAGHGPDGRLGVLDHRPALAHAEWIDTGWPSRHPAVDCLLSDAAHHPDGTADGGEMPILHLDPTTLPAGPALAAADALDRSHIGEAAFAFGWFGPAAGITEEMKAAWARIVRAVPDSVLRLVHEDWRIGRARQSINDAFNRNEVSHRRIVFEYGQTMETRLTQWRHVDVCLDTAPASHMATVLEALAMGVPVMTMAGDRPAGRHASAIARLIGIERFIAADLNDYITRASALFGIKDRLRQLRAQLPERLRRSPLADELSLARRFEALLPAMLAAGARRG